MKIEFVDNSASQYDASASLIQLHGVSGKLFVGDPSAASMVQLQHRKCNAVVCCSSDLFGYCREPKVQYLKVDAAEASEKEMNEVADKIAQWLKDGKVVLLFCESSKTRSAIMIMYCLMRSFGKSLAQGHQLCTKCRGVPVLSPGMAKTLLRYEEKLRGSQTMKVVGKELVYINDPIPEEPTKSINDNHPSPVAVGNTNAVAARRTASPILALAVFGGFFAALFAGLYAATGKV